MLACSLRLPHLAHRRVDMWSVQVVEIRNSLQELYYCEYHARLTAVTSAEPQNPASCFNQGQQTSRLNERVRLRKKSGSSINPEKLAKKIL